MKERKTSVGFSDEAADLALLRLMAAAFTAVCCVAWGLWLGLLVALVVQTVAIALSAAWGLIRG